MKLRLRLVPAFFVRALAVPFMLGAAKYEEGDWATRSPEEVTPFMKDREDSMLRHYYNWKAGQKFDVEGFRHLAAVAWNALLLLYYECQLEVLSNTLPRGIDVDSPQLLYSDTFVESINGYYARKESAEASKEA